jgi:hypothetical protein
LCGLVAYAYDAVIDEKEPLDEEDLLHDSWEKRKPSSRGAGSCTLECFIGSDAGNLPIEGNTRINGETLVW